LRSHPLISLLTYGKAFRGRFIQAIVCSILNKIFDLAPPILIGAAVDAVAQKQNSFLARFGISDVYGQLVLLVVLSAIIWGLESLFEYLYDFLWRNLAQDIEHELRLDAYRHLQDLELAFFEERSTGGLMAILNDDINQLERFLDGSANDILQVLATVIIIGGIFFYLAPGVAAFAMFPMPFILWGSIAFQKLLAPYYAQVREKVGLLNGRLNNNLGGITTIKSFTSEAFEIAQVRSDSDAYRQSNRRAITISAAFVPLIRILILIGFCVTLLFGGMAVAAGTLSVGNYSVLVYLIQRLLWPLTRLGETLDRYQRAMASTNRVMDLLETPIAIATGDQPLPLASVQGDIRFSHVVFGYRDRLPVLKDFSLEIPAGKTTAIVGATGSGKSTLVKLLLRFYEIDSGEITLDGVSLKKLKLEDLRRSIGLVSQDIFLFHGSVRENIAYGNPDASSEAVFRAAQAAEADAFIAELPQGYETIVGERGQKLSGGQRQRLALARAILKDPPILVLDEATSAVDNETEAAIQRSLEKITRNRTTIVIAHRLSTIRNADCIYVMDHGELVEKGQHDALIDRSGIYAGLWQVQTGVKSPR
jgi:ATP-binding cassette, subfamily B, bacterial